MYSTAIQMAGNPSLIARIAACYAAGNGSEEPMRWANANALRLAGSPDWDDAWEFAEAHKTVNVNQDTGMRSDVINDDMILAAVRALINPPVPAE